MNRSYWTVWNAALGACVAVAENVRAPRGGKASGGRRTATAGAALAVAALAAGGTVQAATFNANTEAALIVAINSANASADATSTITLTGSFTVTGALPQPKPGVTIIGTGRTIGIGSAGGAELNIQSGAAYQNGVLNIGTLAGASGTVVAQGSGASLATVNTVAVGGAGTGTLRVLDGATAKVASITTGAVQSTIDVLDGASLTLTGALTTGAGQSTITVARGGSLSSGNLTLASGTSTLHVQEGGHVSGAALTIGTGGRGTIEVSGKDSSLNLTGALTSGTNGTTITVASGGALSATGNLLLGAGGSSLSVLQGSTVKAAALSIGSGGGKGTVEVLDGSALTLSGSLNTGLNQNTIMVARGASLSATDMTTGVGSNTISVLDGGKFNLGNNANLAGTFAGRNGGSVDLTVSGAGSTFNPVSGYYHHTGTLNVSAGGTVQANTVQLGASVGDVFTSVVTGANSLLGSANNNLSIGANGTASVTVADGARLSSGTNGTNTLFLGGTNGSGTLNIGAAVGSSAAAPGIVTAGAIQGAGSKATVNFNHDASAYEFATPITGTAAVNQVGAGTTVFTGDNNYTGLTTVLAGTLQIGNGGNTGTLGSGAVVNDASLVFNRAGNIAMGNTISGSGSVAQNGTGTLTLSGKNNHAGGTVLNSGTLVQGASGAFGTGTLTIAGGTLGSNAGAIGNDITVTGSFNVLPSLTISGPVTLGTTPTITAASGGSVQFTGAIGGAHGLTLNATQAANQWVEYDFVGSAANTYTGQTTVQGNAALGLAKDPGVVAVAGDLLVEGKGIVGLLANEQVADTAAVTVNSTGNTIGGLSYEGLVMVGFGSGSSTQQVETIGTLQGSGTIGLGNGKLVVGQGNFSGVISDGVVATQAGVSGGQLEKTGAGTLTLSGTNTYTGGTALKAGTLAVANNSALGTGALAMDDGTTLAFAADNLTVANPITMTGTNDPTFDTGANTATLTGGISGAADLTKTGTGTLIFGAANNSYTGSTTVAQGILRAGVANALAPASATTIAAGATLDLAGHNQTLASVNNAGTVSLTGSAPGTVLTVTGPWVGNNGILAVGTAVGNDASPTDRLVLSGASAVASGTTRIAVTNIGGLGAQTTGNGIPVVTAENGGSIGAGAFTLATPVSAGAYDYQLNTTSTGSYLANVVPVVPTDPTTPTNPDTPAAPVIPTYRADVPLYAALPEQLRQSNLAMLGNLHQRTGDDGGTGSNTTSPDQGYRQAWGRVISIDRDISQSGTVSPTSKGRLTGFQAGTDLWANANWRTGVYVGQLEGDMSVTGFARGVVNYAAGSNDLRSQYLGAYATWKNDTGLYVDGVLQAGRHRYTVNPTLAFSGSGKGDSLLASIEVGQAFNIAPNWTIEPQLQLVHQRLSLDDTSIVGAWVHQNTDGGWMARAGVRIKGEFQTGLGTLQPYARLNVYKRSSGTDTTSFIGPAASTPILTRTGGTSSEVALGATWQLSQRTSLYGELGKLWASGGDARTKSGVNGSLGVKVRW